MRFLFSWLKSLIFGKNHIENNIPETLPEPTKSGEGRVIGIVVGHNATAQGADNYLGESEYEINSRIAIKLKDKLNELLIPSVIVHRPTGVSYSSQARSVARSLSASGVYAAVLLHFNSAGRGARGCEVLIAKTATPKDNLFADAFTDTLNEEYGFIERGDDGIQTISSSHNGYGMISRINKKGIISALVEPAFADYRTNESRLIFEEEDKYVLVLARAINNTWKKRNI